MTLPELFPELGAQGPARAVPVAASAPVAGKTPTGREKKIRPPLYAEPEGGQGRTWSGQGHRPLWVESAAKKGGAAAVEAMLLPGESHSLGVRTWLEELRMKDAGKTQKQLGKVLPAAVKPAPKRGKGPDRKKTL